MKSMWSSLTAVRAFLLLLVTAVISLALAAPAHATFPGQNGRIVFVDLDPSAYDSSIFSVNPDGSGVTRLTGRGPNDIEPAWSPDGTRILYQNNTSGTRLMNFDGSGNRPVNTLGFEPEWSPDGSKLAVIRSTSGASAVWVMNLDGSGAVKITPPSIVVAEYPDWSPDGATIAFDGSTGSGRDIYTIRPDGTQLTNLTNNAAAYNNWPSWAPDGSRIAFQRNFGDITVMNSDGTQPTPIAGSGSLPVWSPDGSRIAYLRSGSPYTIHTIDPDGANDVPVVADSNPDAALDWQPCQGACPTSNPTPYDSPAASNQIQFRLVPFFRQTISATQCQARGGTNSTHGPPLSLPSCSPISYQPGSVARVGPNAEGGIQYNMIPGSPSNPYGDTLQIIGGISDVRTATGADYPAQATMVTKLRLSDRFSGPDLNQAATTMDFDLSLPMSCAPDPDPDFGSFCGVSSSPAASMPELFHAGRQLVIQVFGLRVYDSGANGTRGDSDDKIFAGQGIYIP